MKRPARFISLEGGDGSGKSTQIKLLAAALKKHGIGTLVTREPGGSPGAEEIRKLLLNGDAKRWDPMTEALLFFAARRDNVEQIIRPALASGQWVISDRFIDSTYAYQGAGHGLARETIRRLETLVLDGFRPDLTLILDLPVEQGLARTQGRAQDMRFEGFDLDFHNRMREAYLNIARRDTARCEIVDASQDEDAVTAAIWTVVAKRFKLK